jgi:hypothetical protein
VPREAREIRRNPARPLQEAAPGLLQHLGPISEDPRGLIVGRNRRAPR